MKKQKHISDNLKKEAPLLFEVEKKNSFSVPKNYFKESLDIKTDKNLNKNMLQILFDKLSYRFYITFSASIIALALLISLVFTTQETTISNEQLSELIIEYDIIEFEDELLYEAYYELEQNTIESENNESLIDYLIENDIETNSIIEEL